VAPQYKRSRQLSVGAHTLAVVHACVRISSRRDVTKSASGLVGERGKEGVPTRNRCRSGELPKAAFVFVLMEPELPKVDRVVLGFLKSEALHPADFTTRADGVVRLNPELAKHVGQLAGAAA
jgi:hypothetical protein